MEISKLFKLLIKRAKIIIPVTLLTVFVTLAYSILITPTYRSNVHWAVKKYSVIYSDNEYQSQEQYVKDLLIEAEILKSPKVVNELIKRCHLPYTYEEFLEKYTPQPYLDRAEVRIYYESKDPQEVLMVLRNIKPVFEEIMTQMDTDVNIKTKVFLDEYYRSMKKTAIQYSKLLEHYEKDKDLVSVSSSVKTFAKNLLTFSNRLNNIEVELAKYRASIAFQKKILGETNIQKIAAKLKLSTNAEIKKLLLSRLEQEIQLDRLENIVTNNHPEIQNIRIQIEKKNKLIKEVMEEVLKKSVSDLYVKRFIPYSGIALDVAKQTIVDDTKVLSLESNKEGNEKTLQKEQELLLNLPDIKFNHTWLELHNLYSWKLLEFNRLNAYHQQIIAELSENNYEIYELKKPEFPHIIYKPDYARNIATALILGLILGFIQVLILEKYINKEQQAA